VKSLVLAEKPSVGRELARVLGCAQKAKGYSEGQDHVVSWAMGHLVELAEPQAYDEKFRHWSLEALPMLPTEMKHRVIPRTGQQFRTIQGLFRRKDVGQLIIATDAGREGELVARWIMRLGGWRGPVQRLWISSQTDAAIREGFRSLKPGEAYENLFHAAECRAEADWIVGLNVTRALSCKHDARLSAGRVQTPTLALIVRRDREIEEFRPEAYWQILADFGRYTGIWRSPQGSTRLKEQARAQGIVEKVRGAEGRVTRIEAKDKSEPPPLAYDLTALQREANSRLGFSAQKTLSVLQGLYEHHKLVTYPRTDSRHITRDMVPTLKDRLKAVLASRLRRRIEELLAGELSPGKRLVDDGKVRDHHAILPTEERADPARLTADERALWEMIVARFVAVLCPPYRYRSITLTTEVAGEQFVSHGVQVIEAGWKAVEGAGEERDADPGAEGEAEAGAPQDLAARREGERVTVVSAEARQGFTKPPPHYTEATLLEAMENAGRFVEDKALKASLARGGLGTPATRAEIIEKLLGNNYVERHGRSLVATSRGRGLLELVPDELRSPELTARWELRLAAIAEGAEQPGDFRRDIRENTRALVERVKASTAGYEPQELSSTPCPMCGRPLMPTLDKKGRKILVCHSLSCGYQQEEAAQRHGGDLSRRRSGKEKAMDRRLIREYGGGGGGEGGGTATFADLIKAARERKQGKA